jgi:hypothetical protein
MAGTVYVHLRTAGLRHLTLGILEAEMFINISARAKGEGRRENWAKSPLKIGDQEVVSGQQNPHPNPSNTSGAHIAWSN